MEVLRMPASRFAGLTGWPYESATVELDDVVTVRGASGDDQLRLAYVDEGPGDTDPVVLMHGEPTWSYLYRHMIPGLVAAGHRVLAPDLVGFGRSDKPTRKGDHRFDRHVGWIVEWLDRLDVERATLFGQDWGGMVGLAALARRPDRFDRVLIANSALPDGAGRWPPAFAEWVARSQAMTELACGDFVGDVMGLDADARRGYDAPFPDPSYQAAPLVFPSLAPDSPEHPSHQPMRDAWEVLDRWHKPFLCCFGDDDPVTGAFDSVYIRRVPGAAGQPHRRLPGGRHFIQEQYPDELVAALDELIRTTRSTHTSA